eukprot:Opistho-1_new@14808
MMARLLTTLLLLALAPLSQAQIQAPAQAVALDASDTGSYAIIDVDGKVTDKVFRVLLNGTQWRLESRKPDGGWEDVSCQGDCQLRVSSEQDLRRIFSVVELPTPTPACVHNKAFAFCRYTAPTALAGTPSHALFAIVNPRPIQIRLSRLTP